MRRSSDRLSIWLAVAVATFAIFWATTQSSSRAATASATQSSAGMVANEETGLDPRFREAVRDQKSPLAAYARGNRLYVVARWPGKGVTLSGALEGDLERLPDADLGENLWLKAFVIDDLDHAILDLIALNGRKFIGYQQFRGRALPSRPTGPLHAGRLISESFQSEALGKVRDLHIYVPFKSLGPMPVVLVLDRGEAADDLIASVDQLISEGAIEPVIVVLPGSAPEEVVSGRTLRGREFLSGLDAVAYDQHARYVYDELLPSVARRFGGSMSPDRTIIVGASAAGAWVISEAARRPDRATVWLAASLPPEIPPCALPTVAAGWVYIGAGRLEPDVSVHSRNTCTAIRRSGGRCRFLTVNGGHTQGVWDALLEQVLRARAPGPATARRS